MKNTDLLIAANTLWVVVAAILVMFMQAGFAFLEAGLTRMKNAAHIAGKNVLIFGVCSLVYWAVGFGIAFGDGNRWIGTSGFAPSVDSLLAIGQAPYSFFTTVPGAAGYFFEVVFAGVSLAIVWGAMAERAKLWVYFVFGALFTLIYSVTSHWVWGGGWLFGLGMQDFAGSTVVHYQGALAALAGALLLGPRIGKFDGRRGNAIPGHNIPYAVLGTLILWFGWFGFNPGSTLGVITGDKVGYFAYVALTTNLAAAAGAVSGAITAWVVLRKPDISMMLNGVLAALVAVTAACGFVAPWAAVVIGLVSGRDRRRRRARGRADRDRRPDRRGRGARSLGRLGHDRHRPLRGARAGRDAQDRLRRLRLHGLAAPGLGAAARPGRGRRVHLLGLVRLPLDDEAPLGHPRRGRDRDRRPGRLRARHVGLPRVLHPGPGRLRDRVARAPARPRAPATTGDAAGSRGA